MANNDEEKNAVYGGAAGGGMNGPMHALLGFDVHVKDALLAKARDLTGMSDVELVDRGWAFTERPDVHSPVNVIAGLTGPNKNGKIVSLEATIDRFQYTRMLMQDGIHLEGITVLDDEQRENFKRMMDEPSEPPVRVHQWNIRFLEWFTQKELRWFVLCLAVFVGWTIGVVLHALTVKH